jgi:hypothetical protein
VNWHQSEWNDRSFSPNLQSLVKKRNQVQINEVDLMWRTRKAEFFSHVANKRQRVRHVHKRT